MVQSRREVVVSLRGRLVGEGRVGSTPGGEEGKIPSNGGISGLKVVFFFPLSREEDMRRVVVDFFLGKRGCEARKEGLSANEKKAWRKIWCGFFFDCGCNGHGAPSNSRLRVGLFTIYCNGGVQARWSCLHATV